MRRIGRIAAVLVAAAAVACTGSKESSPPTLPPPGDPCALSTAGASWVAYGIAAAGTWDVAIARADGSCRRAIASDPSASDFRPAWIGTTAIAYESDRAPYRSIWIHALDSGSEHRLDLGDRRALAPAIAPDGATLAFHASDPAAVSTSSVYVVPLAGGTPVELTPETTPHANSYPAFSPDGTRVYFVSNRTGPWEVFRVSSTTPSFDPEKVTTGSGILGRAAVSPDGAALAFTRTVPGGATSQVVLYDLATATTTPLPVANASDPAFDPAGGRLAVRVLAGGHANIHVATLPGGSTTQVTFDLGPDGAPAFAPLGH